MHKGKTKGNVPQRNNDENTVEDSVIEEPNLEDNAVNEEQNMAEIIPENNEEIDQSLFAPLTDNSEATSPVEEASEVSEDVPVHIPSDAESTIEDDIWKF